MTRNISAIIISPRQELNMPDLLTKLEKRASSPIADQPFEQALYPVFGNAYIGYYNDCLIITDFAWPEGCMSAELSEIERILSAAFPDAEICSLLLYPPVNLWGYSIVKNGEKIRARAGAATVGTFLEMGIPLDEERPLFGNCTVDGEGNKVYLRDGIFYEEDHVGHTFVAAVAERYIGEPLDNEASPLYATPFKGYRYLPERPVAKPWWKFW
ncbi:hypothetical protein ACE38W_01830 [Chitinophaga sp. Hz27]|uniref:DUF6928 family protein n=1 Tax=Chitinophaga sp. Hz27 TaxID=3347169 RepID=UPI0035DD60BF